METTIKQLDKPAVTYIRKRMEAVLKPLATELGVVINIGNCTFNKSNCRFQLKVAMLDFNGKPITEEIESFRHNAKLYGFEPADLNKQFVFQGQSYTIRGLNPKSRKYPIIARAVNGKKYKFPCNIVLKALSRQIPDWLGG